MLSICKTWKSDIWNEMDFNKIKSLPLQEIIGKRKQEEQIIQATATTPCPNFLKHVSIVVFYH